MDETAYWIWLTMIFGVGNYRLWEAMCLFDDVVDACITLSENRDFLKLSSSEKENLSSVTVEKAEMLLEQYRKQGISAIGYSSEKYPSHLRHIMNPPAVIYYRGNIDCLSNRKTISVVGARKASEYSLFAADKICRQLAEKDFLIASGFAAGIDIAANIAAIESERPTVAVLGCGVDVKYPKENFKYKDSITDSGGVLISEYPPATPPYSGNFPRRNRILSGISLAVAVFEASLKSGSLITAGFAAEQGREVFCLPPANIFGENFSGNRELLMNGATPLYGVNDIFDYYSVAYDAEEKPPESHMRRKSVGNTRNIGKINDKSKNLKSDSEKSNKQEDSQKTEVYEAEKIYDELSEKQKSVVELLKSGAMHIDVIAAQLEMESSEIMVEITELELMGAVVSMPGKMFELC